LVGTTSTIAAGSYGATNTDFLPFIVGDNIGVYISVSAGTVSTTHRLALKIKYIANQLS
jgi:hypothetical protein